MKRAIFILGPVGDERSQHDGLYLSAYDPSAGEHGRIESTYDIAEALHFDGAAEALQCWQQVNQSHPWRPDGKPNRPLTAFSVQIVEVP